MHHSPRSFLRAAAALSLVSIITITGFPFAAFASHTDGNETYSRYRESSTLRKKIQQLDDDEVEKLPIPILLGLSLRQISSDFGDPRGGGTREHEGQDLIAPRDAFIVSPTEAVVTRTGKGESSGIFVSTANPGGETFIYMHLDDIADGVKAGTVLKPGDLIGYVGDTGNAKGGVTHLHFEIREGRKATDPFPRLAREFTTEERIESLTKILSDTDNDDVEELAQELVRKYRSLFVQAIAQDIDLPNDITKAMGATVATGATASGPRDLTLGSQGDDVTLLQAFLVKDETRTAARALAKAGVTGYFGPLTQAALAEYQATNGISPASGYFGPLTRAHIEAAGK